MTILKSKIDAERKKILLATNLAAAQISIAKEAKSIIQTSKASIIKAVIDNKKKDCSKKPKIAPKPKTASKKSNKPAPVPQQCKPNDKSLYKTTGIDAHLISHQIKKIQPNDFASISRFIPKIAGMDKLSFSLQKHILYLNLNLAPSLARCEASNGVGSCERVFGIMAVRKCP